MSNDKKDEFHGELLPPEVIRKGVYELGKVNRIPPEVGIFDAPTRCFVVNVEWWSHIAGMVHLLADVVSWRDAEDESYFAIVEILKFMQGINCMDFQLRQNPDDACVLDQSTDGGATWLSVFDFSQCLSIVDGSSSSSQVNTFYNATFQSFEKNIYNNFVENYVSSITDIAPELGYGDSDDEFRDAALCDALGKLIDSICLAANEYFDNESETANDLKNSLVIAGAILGIIALAATGVGTPAAAVLAGQAGLWAAGIGLGSALGTALYDHYLDTNQAAYNDNDAKLEVLCCLVAELSGANVDKADLVAAFSCTGLSTNAQAIHDAAAILVQENAMYAAFVQNMSIGFQSAKLSLLPDCPCSGEWCYELDLTLFTNWDISINSGNQFAGTLAGSQWNTSDTQPAGSGKVRAIGVGYDFGFTTFIKRVEIDYSSDYGNGAGGKYSARFYLRMGTSTAYDSLNSGAQAPEGANLTFSRGTNNPSCNNIRIAQVVDNTSGTLAGSGNITAVRVYGDGVNPFGADNC